MQDIQPELIEKFQILLEKDPKSQVFAPLSEAYRKMGMVEEAFRVAVRGVQFNPNFSGGRIALAKIYLDRDNVPGATEELTKAVELSADNILAHSLLGECHLKSKRPKEALRSFKMVLFLAPTNEKALRAVRTLEALTADEYEDDLFEMKQLPQFDQQLGQLQPEELTRLKPLSQNTSISHGLERILSLTDAYIVRNDMLKASEVLRQGEMDYGSHPELVKRLKLVNQRGYEPESTAETEIEPPPSREQSAVERKIEFLQALLKRIQAYSQFT